MAVVVVCVEPRGPASPIGVLNIQMTAVMRREFGTAEPPSSEVELGRGRANERSGPCPLTLTTPGRSLLAFCSKANLIQKKRQLKCDLGDLGGVSAPASRLSWNFDLLAVERR